MPYPSQWKTLCDLRRKTSDAVLPSNVSGSELNRFAARYRLASSFSALVIDDYADDSIDAYSAVLRAFLAYSALEQFHKAVKPAPPNQHLNARWAEWARQPASDLRNATDILHFLELKMSNGKLKARLKQFACQETDNCLVVATALRNAVAHGFMTVHPEGSAARSSEKFCTLIADMLLQIAERAFTEFVEAIDS